MLPGAGAGSMNTIRVRAGTRTCMYIHTAGLQYYILLVSLSSYIYLYIYWNYLVEHLREDHHAHVRHRF